MLLQLVKMPCQIFNRRSPWLSMIGRNRDRRSERSRSILAYWCQVMGGRRAAYRAIWLEKELHYRIHKWHWDRIIRRIKACWMVDRQLWITTLRCDRIQDRATCKCLYLPTLPHSTDQTITPTPIKELSEEFNDDFEHTNGLSNSCEASNNI